MRRRSKASRALATLVSMTVWLHTGVARAADADPVEALIQKGSEARAQGRDEDALKYFEQADTAHRSPTTRAQIALAEQALGLWLRAETHLLEALVVPDDPWVQRHKAALDGALATIRQHLGTLELRGLSSDVTVTIVIDGATMEKLPVAGGFRVESGKRQLEIRAAGYHPLTRTVWIPEGGVARETVTLVRSSEARPPHDDSANGVTGKGVPSMPVSSTRRTIGWASIAVGGAATVLGGISLVLRQGAADRYNSPECPGIGPGVTQSPTCQSHIDAEGTWKAVGLTSFIGAGVFVIAGVVLVATAPSAESSRSATAATSFVSCGGGFLCPARF